MRDLTPKTHRLAVQGTEFVVREYPCSASPLFFCHCTGTSGRIWEPVFRKLKLDHTFYAWDARGHGDSEKTSDPGDYNWDRQARDLLDIFEQLGLDHLQAVGHSGGGAALAQAELLRPGTFSRLMLIDPIIASPDFFAGVKILAELSRRRHNRFSSREVARERFSSKEPMSRWTAESLDCYLDHCFEAGEGEEIVLKCPGPIEALVYDMSGETEIMSRLNGLEPPTCLVTGEDSYMLHHAEEQQRRIPGSELVILPSTSHFIPQEKPDEVAELINRWFGEG
ncbi:MAG: alpha/beta hydrolase [Candidatus Hydrogenedens sp.]|jgi:pimeloyl-ACP methyl ester carboxylesterase|nr:alpha/beta hydrolase [Candidatus Hydrogenedens sp.]